MSRAVEPGRAPTRGSDNGLIPIQGLRENLGRFATLLLQVFFVGAMVGVERTVLPILAIERFGLVSKTAVLTFILAFGLAKAPGNLIAGRLADRFGRRRVLLAGWAILADAIGTVATLRALAVVAIVSAFAARSGLR